MSEEPKEPLTCRHCWEKAPNWGFPCEHWEELIGDAATLRGYIAIYGETPSMTRSTMERYRKTLEEAMEHLRFATPSNRNGPCIKAMSIIGKALKME